MVFCFYACMWFGSYSYCVLFGGLELHLKVEFNELCILQYSSKSENSMEDNIPQFMVFDMLITHLLYNAMIPKGGNQILPVITLGNKRAEQLNQHRPGSCLLTCQHSS